MTLTPKQAADLRSKLFDDLEYRLEDQLENRASSEPDRVLMDATQTFMGPAVEISIPDWEHHVWVIVNKDLAEIDILCIHDYIAKILDQFVGGVAPTMDYIDSKVDAEGFGVYRGPVDSPDTATQFVLDWILNNSPA